MTDMAVNMLVSVNSGAGLVEIRWVWIFSGSAPLMKACTIITHTVIKPLNNIFKISV